MKVKECTLEQLFVKTSCFVVPPFQRRYAWKEVNFKKLWDDIQQVLDGSSKRHFMGTLILEPSPSNGGSLVIDGQQRLTTYLVMIKVLEDLSRQYSPERTRKLTGLLERSGRSRFVPSLPDKEAFETLLDNPHLLRKGKDHRNLRCCFEFFSRELGNYVVGTSGTKRKNFERIIETLLHKMIFVELELADADDPHSIFETINYAGVPLTSADLARNFVLGLAKRGLSPTHLNKTYWQPLESRLEDSLRSTGKARKAELQKVLPELIRSFLVVEKGKYISTSDAFREFRTYFRTGSVEAKLQKLCRCSETFCKFLNPDLEKHKSVRIHLQNFVDLRMTTHYPVLIVLYRALQEGRMSVADLRKCMQYIESFVLRRAFKSKLSRDLNIVFMRVAAKLMDRTKGRRSVERVFAQLLNDEGWPQDDEFKATFVSSPIYSTAPAIARYALVAIEKKNSTTHREMSFDRSIQVEHVFPQQERAGDWAKEDLPGLKKNLHVIGNLTLTGYNGKQSNHSFAKKRPLFRKSQYWLTKATIGTQSRWTAREIDKRSSRLLTQALALWPGG